jgi:hypothetical protein
MTFLNPLLLFGVGAIAAPIIIHMLMNRRMKPVVWAAMRFLRAAVIKNQKKMNIEDIVLLVLRCLLLIVLALALARPVFRNAGAAMTGRGVETAVIALDNSYSMGQSDGGETRFEQARQAAEQVIDSMEPGSSVAVFLFSDVVKTVIPQPTYDLNLARKTVRDAALSDRGTDVDTALKQAVSTLEGHSTGVERIYLVTDGQAAGWKQFDDITKTIQNPAISTSVILVGGPELHNLCVSDLQLADPMAAVGETAEFDVQVTNYGATDAKEVAVRLSVDEESASDQGVIDSIPPGESKRLALFTKFDAAGYHTVTGSINADHLPTDDQRTIAVRAMDDVRVLLVTEDTNAAPAENSTYYLANALAPVAPSDRESYLIKTKTISPGELDSTKLSDYEAVVLANVRAIPATSVEALAGYLKLGGGLILFPGDKTDADFYNGNFGKKLGMLPARLGTLRGNAGGAYLKLQSGDYTHRIVSIWNDPGAGTLGTAHFYRAYELKPATGRSDQAGEPQLVLKYADGTPAVIERTWGRGRVILFSSSADATWNDLPLHPAFVPLMERTLGDILERQDARLNVQVGSPFELVCNPDWVDKDAIITRAGEKEDTGSLRHIENVDGVPLLQYADTEKAGGYEAKVKSDPPATIKFAVQFDPAESDLAGLSTAQLDALTPPARVIHWTEGMRLDEQIAKDRGGSEIWQTLAMLVVATAVAELALSGIFSAAK